MPAVSSDCTSSKGSDVVLLNANAGIIQSGSLNKRRRPYPRRIEDEAYNTAQTEYHGCVSSLVSIKFRSQRLTEDRHVSGGRIGVQLLTEILPTAYVSNEGALELL